jgi:RNA polymerase sigma-70 factor (ECF subfamily)
MPDRTAPPAFAAQARDTANALYRSDSRRVFATLVRLLGDFDVAEEALHDAFAAALEQWPQDGIPANPRAWLVSAGRFKAIDAIRRRARMQPLPDDYEERFAAETGDPSQIESEKLEDDRLRLIFTCCHPALAVEAQIALTLREVCGLATEEIARAFLAPTATLAQRIVRAKAKIRNAGIPYQVPARRELADRLEAVLRVVYLVFNEGYSASAGASLTRHDLSAEAIRLGRLLAQLQPEPETLGLLGLMLLHESRRAARTAPNGDIILLDQQDRSIWDRALIVEGSALAQRALATNRVGTYALQAAIAAVHANAQKPEDTDWSQIAALYDLLMRAEPSPVVELNRAVAVGMRDGAEAGLDLIDALFARGELANYRLAHATRADFCRRLGRTHEARAAYMRALELTDQEPERRFLERRLLELTS